MPIDIHVKSSELLESLANSIYDREKPANVMPVGPFLFTLTEIQLVERWLRDIINNLDPGSV